MALISTWFLKTSYNDFANYYLEEIILTKIFDLETNKQFLNKRLLHCLNKIGQHHSKIYQQNQRMSNSYMMFYILLKVKILIKYLLF